MKIRIEDETYEGSGTEIMEQLRETLGRGECSDTASYITQLRANFIRSTGLECDLPVAGVERRALAMIAQLAKAGALVVLDDG